MLHQFTNLCLINPFAPHAKEDKVKVTVPSECTKVILTIAAEHKKIATFHLVDLFLGLKGLKPVKRISWINFTPPRSLKFLHVFH